MSMRQATWLPLAVLVAGGACGGSGVAPRDGGTTDLARDHAADVGVGGGDAGPADALDAKEDATSAVDAPTIIDTVVTEAGSDGPRAEGGGAETGADGPGADAGFTDEYDLGREFSLTKNPNGVWRYGSTKTLILKASDFQLDEMAVTTTPVGFWHPGPALGGYYPYVAENSGATSAADPTKSWALRAGEVAMEGGPAGNYSAVQFVAPSSGLYDIAADFSGVHYRLSSTDVHVLLGETALFDAQIAGYGGDPAFHMAEGQTPNASYHASRALQAGDVLTFAVGIGANGTYQNDTTGLLLHIRR